MSREGSDFTPVYRWCEMNPNEFDGIYSEIDFEAKMNELGFPYQSFPTNVQNKVKDIVGFKERPPDTDRRQIVDDSVDDLREDLIEKGVIEEKPFIIKVFDKIKEFLGGLF